MSYSFALLILALYPTALFGEGGSKVVRKKEGESFNISCSTAKKPQGSLILYSSLDNKETPILNLDLKKNTLTTIPHLNDRVKYLEDGDPYKLSIIISNLKIQDTQIYSCMFNRFDPANATVFKTAGGESVLLVVDEKCNADEWSSLRDHLLFGSVSICGTLFLIGLAVYICWTRKARRARKRVCPTRTNDVYEDMRATIRR